MIIGVALTAIFSFVFGLLVACATLHVLISMCEGKYAAVFVGGVVRGMGKQGVSLFLVRAVSGTTVAIDAEDLAMAIEATLHPPSDDGGGGEPV